MPTYNLGSVTQIPEGEGRTFDVAGHQVAVFRTRRGGVYATAAECPHRKGPLADGLLGGTTISCPLHEWTFDLATGERREGGCSIAVYPITQHTDGSLVLELETRPS